MKANCSALILAAGISNRMGKPKLMLQMDNNITFLENIANKYNEFGCSKIIVVLNNEGIDLLKLLNIKLPSQTILVLNNHLEFGRFYSIYLGAEQVSSDYVFIQNVDNPYAHKEVLSQLYKNKQSNGYVVPVLKGRGGHPVLISRKIINKIQSENEFDYNLKDYLTQFSKNEVEIIDDSILLNINTPDDYKAFVG